MSGLSPAKALAQWIDQERERARRLADDASKSEDERADGRMVLNALTAAEEVAHEARELFERKPDLYIGLKYKIRAVIDQLRTERMLRRVLRNAMRDAMPP